MKTTVDLDESKLNRVMKLTGLNTRKAAIDFALREAERSAHINKLISSALADEEFTNAVDPRYDLIALRVKERRSRT